MGYSGVEMVISFASLLAVIVCVMALLTYLMKKEEDKTYIILRNMYKECQNEPTIDFEVPAMSYLMGKGLSWNMAVNMIETVAGSTKFKRNGNVHKM